MKITRLETFLANAGLRNYLFLRLTTDTGLTVIGADPFNIEAVIGSMIRDQYQGGSTVMTAISGVEIALWDLVGKACGQPLHRLLGGRCHSRISAYANGWY